MNASALPIGDACPVCLAIQPLGEGAAGAALPDDAATIIMTVRDENGRRAIIRTEIPMATWNAADPNAAGQAIVKELKFGLSRLRLTAEKQAKREQA